MIQRKGKLVSELHGALKQKCYDIFLKADRLSGCRYAPEPRRDDVRSAPRRPRATSRSEQTYAFAFQFGPSVMAFISGVTEGQVGQSIV